MTTDDSPAGLFVDAPRMIFKATVLANSSANPRRPELVDPRHSRRPGARDHRLHERDAVWQHGVPRVFPLVRHRDEFDSVADLQLLRIWHVTVYGPTCPQNDFLVRFGSRGGAEAQRDRSRDHGFHAVHLHCSPRLRASARDHRSYRIRQASARIAWCHGRARARLSLFLQPRIAARRRPGKPQRSPSRQRTARRRFRRYLAARTEQGSLAGQWHPAALACRHRFGPFAGQAVFCGASRQIPPRSSPGNTQTAATSPMIPAPSAKAPARATGISSRPHNWYLA